MDSLTLPDEVRFQIDGLLELLDSLEVRIRKVAKRIEHRVDVTPEAQLLMTVPGIGAKTAMLIMAEIGDLSRFPSSHHLTSFAGLVPTTRSYGGKTTHGSLPHAGSPWLRWALVESTQTLKMRPGLVRAHFTRLTRAKGNSKATVAAARKLCCYLFWMRKEQRTYPEWLQNRHSIQPLEVRPT
jgi:transposase